MDIDETINMKIGVKFLIMSNRLHCYRDKRFSERLNDNLKPNVIVIIMVAKLKKRFKKYRSKACS